MEFRCHFTSSGTWNRAGIRFVALCSALTFASGAWAASQQPPVLKVQTEVVNVYAVVRDKKGHLIPDLTQRDFEITEDGVPQQIRYFSRATDTPLTLGMMIDTSPSQQRVLPLEQRQADAFLREVIRPKDLTFVLHFDIGVELLQDFTPDLARLTQAIDETVINGGAQGPVPGTFPSSNGGATHLYDAVWLASNDLMKNQVGRKVLILLTDGEDQGSKESLKASLEAAQKSDVMIYAVDIVDRAFYGFGNMGFHGDEVLKEISEKTGGEVIRVTRKKDTSAAFQEIARQLRTQYLLGYTSTNRAHDGTYRKIRVRVRDGKDKVQARTGYYAPSQ
ncbi:MAG TPA: VWA domain-containing protein [Terriglobia bacterium]|nr:VWA domain-containing protein [Terriglobia bacterium]